MPEGFVGGSIVSRFHDDSLPSGEPPRKHEDDLAGLHNLPHDWIRGGGRVEQIFNTSVYFQTAQEKERQQSISAVSYFQSAKFDKMTYTKT